MNGFNIEKLQKFKKFSWLFVIVVLTILAIIPLLTPGYLDFHDRLQYLRMQQMHECIMDSQIPARWVSDMGFGYGYPLFLYYGPLPYYLGEIIHLLGLSYFWTIKILFIVGFLASGIFMYLLTREFFGYFGALISAIFYIYAPYHAVDVYVRGSLNEFFCFIWLPAIFWAIYKLVKEEKKIFIFILSIFLAFLLLSHNVMVMLFIPFIFAWIVFLIIYLKKYKSIILIIYSSLLALGLSSFFIVSVLFERGLVNMSSLIEEYFIYYRHFPSIKQLFISRFWGFGGSTFGFDDTMSFSIGHLHWIFSLIVFIGALIVIIKNRLWGKGRNREYLVWYCIVFFSLVTFLYTFMMNRRSIFIWEIIPFLKYTQFPWRLLVVVSFGLSFICGGIVIFFIDRYNPLVKEIFSSIGELIKKKNKMILLITILLVSGVIIWNFKFFQKENDINLTEKYYFSQMLSERQQWCGNSDFLPVQVKINYPEKIGTHTPFFVEGNGNIYDFTMGSNWQNFNADVTTDDASIRLQLFDFSDWQVLVNEKKVIIDSDNKLGLITFNAFKGNNEVRVSLGKTKKQVIADFISLVSWIFLIVGLIWSICIIRINRKFRNIK